MKRLLALLLILTNFLFLVGCATKIKDDFSVVTHIEITKYRTVWEEGDTEKILASVKLDKKEDSEDIEHICENLASLSLKKMNGNKPTMLEYTLVFYNYHREIQTISITAHGWIDYDGDFHTVEDGTLDLEYIDALMDSN